MKPKHLTRSHQRYARSHVTTESLRASGRKGAAATRAKYGADFLLQRVRRYRIDHPSYPELVMIGVLKHLGVESEREWQIAGSLYCADFYLPKSRKAIEVHGAIHGRLKKDERMIHDENKARLCAEIGIDLLIVTEAEFTQGESLVARIKEFLG